MQTRHKIITIVTLILISMSYQACAEDIVGGGGSAAEKLILDWAKFAPGYQKYSIKINNTFSSADLDMLQKGKIDFSILDSPLSENELVKKNLLQFPFALSGISIVVNLPNALSGTLKLDSKTIGKIFSGAITSWNDPAITALNPKHDLPNEPIIIIHSDESSTDYPAINSYLGNISEKWKSGDSKGKKRVWPAKSILTDGLSERIFALQHNIYSIGYLPMQYMSQFSLLNIQIANKDGNFVSLSDTGIVASTSNVDINGSADNLVITNKNGANTWPISNFVFIVVNKERIKDAKIVQFLKIINFGLKFASLKYTLYNYVALPDQLSSPAMAKIENIIDPSSTASKEVNIPAIEVNQENTPTAEESRRAAEGRRAVVRQQQLEIKEREQAIREARAAKIAAEEAIKAAKAAKAAKLEADALAEKNRLIAKAEKDKADKEKAEKEKIAKVKAEKERAIQLRNQKDEDPAEAYRRSMSSQ
jgi:phosphate transport system substrate-binding protein